jgi:glutathione synthase/RimK-type ligase-like ATP-grasp enzyme
VYCREDVSPPAEALDIAVKAVAALGLDFGAVDVAWNEHYNKCVVFEVNTAPGLYGHTLDVYVNAIKEML